MSESNALPSRSSFLGSQSGRQNLGVSSFSKPAASTKTPENEAPKAETGFTAPSPPPDGAKQRLTSFLNKLETTWQLFNRGTRESDEGALPKDKPAYLEEKDVPTADTLKDFRAQVARGSGPYLSKGQSAASSGPKEAPLSERGTGKGGPKPSSQESPSSTQSGQPRSTASPGKAPEGSPKPSSSWQPTGTASSRSFLATSSSAGAQMRSSDAMGRPGAPAQAENLARQPVFSQSLANVNSRVTSRQVTSSSPVFHPFLDQQHQKTSAQASGLRLSWQGGQASTGPQNPLANQPRLQLSQQAQGGQSLGQPLNLHNSAQAMAARVDIATRFAGKAVHSLLKKLYDEEDLEELDEEEAVSGLGLILRLGGDFTYEHSTRVLELALELADEVGIEDQTTRREIEFGAAFRDLGELDLLLGSRGEEQMGSLEDFMSGQDVLRAGLLHDIGKVNIPPEILNKPGKLTPEEYELMKMHPIYGEEIVRPIASLRYLCPTIRGHHERWDGQGYPDGLAGADIPIAARIISVADVFDALSAERPYKAGMEIQKVREILAEGRESHFDPTLVDAFLGIIDRRYPDDALSVGSAPSE